MNPDGRESREERLLTLAPTGKDGTLLCDKLRGAGFACELFPDLGALVEAIAQGAGALLLAEEALAGDAAPLAAWIERQEPWSDLPVLVMTRPGADSPALTHAVRTLGNVTLLERPVRIATLTSAVRTALRARQRQYLARSHIEQQNEAARALQEADRRKDEFLATLAHELRNPLAPLRNSLGILRLNGELRSCGNIIEMMDRQVAHMVRLVDDLLEVSRITRGRIELRREVIGIAAVVEAAVETSRPLVQASRHAVTVDLPPEPLHVAADAVRLAQVFANLINNAAKYTPEGGRIAITARKTGGDVVVTVKDNGEGIPAEALPRVFEMFTQGENARRRGQGGLGIGLTLARSLTEMHGGTIAAHSEGPGRGSEFAVRLPLHAASDGAKAAARTVPAPIPQPTRVLVVDDNEDAADSMGTLLGLLGAEAQVVHDGISALEAMSLHRPRIVLLDIGMPGMDGYEVARRIRAQAAYRDVVLIALTGWGQEHDRSRAQAAGFDHHLIKPADIGALQLLLASADQSPSAAIAESLEGGAGRA